MSADVLLIGTICIIVIIGLFGILGLMLFSVDDDNHNQNNNRLKDENHESYNEKLKELNNLNKRDNSYLLNGKIKNIKNNEYTSQYKNSNIIFMNKDNIFDIKLPYHFVSPSKSFSNNQSYQLDDKAKNYTALYLTDYNISFIEKQPSLVNNLDRINNDNYKNYYTLNDYKQVYDLELTHQINHRQSVVRNLNENFDNKDINNIYNHLQEFMKDNNLNVEELSQYFKNQNKKIQLDNDDFNQFLTDYKLKIDKLQQQKRQNLLIKLDEFKNEIKSVDQNKSYFYDEIKDLII